MLIRGILSFVDSFLVYIILEIMLLIRSGFVVMVMVLRLVSFRFVCFKVFFIVRFSFFVCVFVVILGIIFLKVVCNLVWL